jgi:hypothetical protein
MLAWKCRTFTHNAQATLGDLSTHATLLPLEIYESTYN